jgi:hypothetical protein
MACLWFWAWALVGALAVLSIFLGVPAVAATLVLGALVAKVGDSHRSVFGLVTGAGFPLLWVAYVQRQGPGTTCWHTASAMGCDQHSNPLPWLIVGLILVLGGLVGHKGRDH